MGLIALQTQFLLRLGNYDFLAWNLPGGEAEEVTWQGLKLAYHIAYRGNPHKGFQDLQVMHIRQDPSIMAAMSPPGCLTSALPDSAGQIPSSAGVSGPAAHL